MAKTLKFKDIDWLFVQNKHSDDYPIIVNTAGYYQASCSFETHNSIGRDDFYLIYIIDGRFSVIIDNNEFTCKKGTAVIFPPKCSYKYSAELPAHYLYAHFTGSYAGSFLKELGFDKLPCVIDNEFNIEVENKFNKLIDIFYHNEPLSIQKCGCLLQEILLEVFQDALDKSSNSPLKASMKHIHSFYTEKIEIPQLAKMESLSNSRYIAVFKKQTGKSPNEYIIGLRLSLARSLLENTNMSIRKIAEKIGYMDPYFFSRLFKKYVGASPQQYRKKKLL